MVEGAKLGRAAKADAPQAPSVSPLRGDPPLPRAGEDEHCNITGDRRLRGLAFLVHLQVPSMTFAFRSFALAVATLALAAAICASANASRDGDLATVKASRGAATRDGPRLTLHFASGGTFIYEDAAACDNEDDLDDANCYGYELAGHEREWHLFRVLVYLWEGQSHIFVDDRTGEETHLDGYPLFSQSGNQIVEILYGPDGYDATGPAVQVWRRQGTKFVVEWTGSPYKEPETQYSVLGWWSPGRIDLRATTRGEWDREAGRSTPDIVKYFTLKRRPKGWRLFADEGELTGRESRR
jgi:hypothetical protein